MKKRFTDIALGFDVLVEAVTETQNTIRQSISDSILAGGKIESIQSEYGHDLKKLELLLTKIKEVEGFLRSKNFGNRKRTETHRCPTALSTRRLREAVINTLTKAPGLSRHGLRGISRHGLRDALRDDLKEYFQKDDLDKLDSGAIRWEAKLSAAISELLRSGTIIKKDHQYFLSLVG